MSQLTTHILDTAAGKPAEGIRVLLSQQQGKEWNSITAGETNADGRVHGLLDKEMVLAPGVYKLRFETRPYFEKRGIESFFPYVEISFTVTGNEHYHVPLLLSPFGYSTYRGS